MIFAPRKLRGAGIGAGANLKWVSLGLALFLLSCGEDGGVGSGGASVAERLQEASALPPVDYLNLDRWGCHAGKASDECTRPYRIERIEADGSVREEAPLRDDPAKMDCFFTYPTVDWNPKAGNHEDLTDVLIPALTIRALASRFSEVCRVFAPYYRQGTLGSYLIPAEEGAPIFRAAFADVAVAFETYLREWNEGRPLVVIGHSQGAQMASYLLHQYFDGSREVTRVPGRRRSNELRADLVLALPIGFNTYVSPGERVGGSFSDLPLCTDAPERGCVLHYRSHADGDDPKPGSAGGGVDAVLAPEGYLHRVADGERDEVACTNPALAPLPEGHTVTDIRDGRAEPGDVRILDGTTLTGLFVSGGAARDSASTFRHYPGRYTATCRRASNGDTYLAIGFHEDPGGADQRGDPMDVRTATGPFGLHLYDFNLAIGDLIEQIRRRAGVLPDR